MMMMMLFVTGVDVFIAETGRHYVHTENMTVDNGSYSLLVAMRRVYTITSP